MAGKQECGSDIVRSLEEGWHYQPDWRNRVVEALMVEHGAEVDSIEVLKDEHDAYVRQFYMFRRTAGCLGKEAVRWAYQCNKHDTFTGAGALIKAMTLAGVPTKEIAHKLRTKTNNIAVYLKLYFDVERYLGERTWLASIVFRGHAGVPTLAEFRQEHWMSAALLGGREALDRAVGRQVPATSEARDTLLAEIRSALTVRAHDYVSALQRGMVQPGPEDFDRLLRLLDASSRQPPADKQASLMNVWIRALHADIKEKGLIPVLDDDTDVGEPGQAGDLEVSKADAGTTP